MLFHYEKNDIIYSSCDMILSLTSSNSTTGAPNLDTFILESGSANEFANAFLAELDIVT